MEEGQNDTVIVLNRWGMDITKFDEVRFNDDNN